MVVPQSSQPSPLLPPQHIATVALCSSSFSLASRPHFCIRMHSFMPSLHFLLDHLLLTLPKICIPLTILAPFPCWTFPPHPNSHSLPTTQTSQLLLLFLEHFLSSPVFPRNSSHLDFCPFHFPPLLLSDGNLVCNQLLSQKFSVGEGGRRGGGAKLKITRQKDVPT